MAVLADDPAAVAALEQAGFSLKKNAAGGVTEISVSVSADKDLNAVSAALQQLAGLHSVTVARLGGPGLQDAAMQPLSNLSGLKRLEDRKSTRLNSSHIPLSRMPSSA